MKGTFLNPGPQSGVIALPDHPQAFFNFQSVRDRAAEYVQEAQKAHIVFSSRNKTQTRDQQSTITNIQISDVENESSISKNSFEGIENQNFEDHLRLAPEIYVDICEKAPWAIERIHSYLNQADQYDALSQEMIDFEYFMQATVAEYFYRRMIVDRVAGIVEKLWPNATLRVYGSLATGLYLPTSDIDITIVGVPDGLPKFQSNDKQESLINNTSQSDKHNETKQLSIPNIIQIADQILPTQLMDCNLNDNQLSRERMRNRSKKDFPDYQSQSSSLLTHSSKVQYLSILYAEINAHPAISETRIISNARVPLIKHSDRVSKINVDISINLFNGIANSFFVRSFLNDQMMNGKDMYRNAKRKYQLVKYQEYQFQQQLKQNHQNTQQSMPELQQDIDIRKHQNRRTSKVSVKSNQQKQKMNNIVKNKDFINDDKCEIIEEEKRTNASERIVYIPGKKIIRKLKKKYRHVLRQRQIEIQKQREKEKEKQIIRNSDNDNKNTSIDYVQAKMNVKGWIRSQRKMLRMKLQRNGERLIGKRKEKNEIQKYKKIKLTDKKEEIEMIIKQQKEKRRKELKQRKKINQIKKKQILFDQEKEKGKGRQAQNKSSLFMKDINSSFGLNNPLQYKAVNQNISDLDQIDDNNIVQQKQQTEKRKNDGLNVSNFVLIDNGMYESSSSDDIDFEINHRHHTSRKKKKNIGTDNEQNIKYISSNSLSKQLHTNYNNSIYNSNIHQINKQNNNFNKSNNNMQNEQTLSNIISNENQNQLLQSQIATEINSQNQHIQKQNIFIDQNNQKQEINQQQEINQDLIHSDSHPNPPPVSSLLRPLLFVMKTFLMEKQLNEPYKGGMGSYLLTLITISHLQMYQINYGEEDEEEEENRKLNQQNKNDDIQNEDYVKNDEFDDVQKNIQLNNDKYNHNSSTESLNNKNIIKNSNLHSLHFPSLGRLLLNFFHLYSQNFNFAHWGISIRKGGFYFNRHVWKEGLFSTNSYSSPSQSSQSQCNTSQSPSQHSFHNLTTNQQQSPSKQLQQIQQQYGISNSNTSQLRSRSKIGLPPTYPQLNTQYHLQQSSVSLCVEDPENTNMDVGNGCFRFELLQKQFGQAYLMLSAKYSLAEIWQSEKLRIKEEMEERKRIMKQLELEREKIEKQRIEKQRIEKEKNEREKKQKEKDKLNKKENQKENEIEKEQESKQECEKIGTITTSIKKISSKALSPSLQRSITNKQQQSQQQTSFSSPSSLSSSPNQTSRIISVNDQSLSSLSTSSTEPQINNKPQLQSDLIQEHSPSQQTKSIKQIEQQNKQQSSTSSQPSSQPSSPSQTNLASNQPTSPPWSVSGLDKKQQQQLATYPTILSRLISINPQFYEWRQERNRWAERELSKEWYEKNWIEKKEKKEREEKERKEKERKEKEKQIKETENDSHTSNIQEANQSITPISSLSKDQLAISQNCRSQSPQYSISPSLQTVIQSQIKRSSSYISSFNSSSLSKSPPPQNSVVSSSSVRPSISSSISLSSSPINPHTNSILNQLLSKSQQSPALIPPSVNNLNIDLQQYINEYVQKINKNPFAWEELNADILIARFINSVQMGAEQRIEYQQMLNEKSEDQLYRKHKRSHNINEQQKEQQQTLSNNKKDKIIKQRSGRDQNPRSLISDIDISPQFTTISSPFTPQSTYCSTEGSSTETTSQQFRHRHSYLSSFVSSSASSSSFHSNSSDDSTSSSLYSYSTVGSYNSYNSISTSHNHKYYQKQKLYDNVIYTIFPNCYNEEKDEDDNCVVRRATLWGDEKRMRIKEERILKRKEQRRLEKQKKKEMRMFEKEIKLKEKEKMKQDNQKRRSKLSSNEKEFQYLEKDKDKTTPTTLINPQQQILMNEIAEKLQSSPQSSPSPSSYSSYSSYSLLSPNSQHLTYQSLATNTNTITGIKSQNQSPTQTPQYSSISPQSQHKFNQPINFPTSPNPYELLHSITQDQNIDECVKIKEYIERVTEKVKEMDNNKNNKIDFKLENENQILFINNNSQIPVILSNASSHSSSTPEIIKIANENKKNFSQQLPSNPKQQFSQLQQYNIVLPTNSISQQYESNMIFNQNSTHSLFGIDNKNQPQQSSQYYQQQLLSSSASNPSHVTQQHSFYIPISPSVVLKITPITKFSHLSSFAIPILLHHKYLNPILLSIIKSAFEESLKRKQQEIEKDVNGQELKELNLNNLKNDLIPSVEKHNSLDSQQSSRIISMNVFEEIFQRSTDSFTNQQSDQQESNINKTIIHSNSQSLSPSLSLMHASSPPPPLPSPSTPSTQFTQIISDPSSQQTTPQTIQSQRQLNMNNNTNQNVNNPTSQTNQQQFIYTPTPQNNILSSSLNSLAHLSSLIAQVSSSSQSPTVKYSFAPGIHQNSSSPSQYLSLSSPSQYLSLSPIPQSSNSPLNNSMSAVTLLTYQPNNQIINQQQSSSNIESSSISPTQTSPQLQVQQQNISELYSKMESQILSPLQVHASPFIPKTQQNQYTNNEMNTNVTSTSLQTHQSSPLSSPTPQFPSLIFPSQSQTLHQQQQFQQYQQLQQQLQQQQQSNPFFYSSKTSPQQSQFQNIPNSTFATSFPVDGTLLFPTVLKPSSQTDSQDQLIQQKQDNIFNLIQSQIFPSPQPIFSPMELQQIDTQDINQLQLQQLNPSQPSPSVQLSPKLSAFPSPSTSSSISPHSQTNNFPSLSPSIISSPLPSPKQSPLFSSNRTRSALSAASPAFKPKNKIQANLIISNTNNTSTDNNQNNDDIKFINVTQQKSVTTPITFPSSVLIPQSTSSTQTPSSLTSLQKENEQIIKSKNENILLVPIKNSIIQQQRENNAINTPMHNSILNKQNDVQEKESISESAQIEEGKENRSQKRERKVQWKDEIDLESKERENKSIFGNISTPKQDNQIEFSNHSPEKFDLNKIFKQLDDSPKKEENENKNQKKENENDFGKENQIKEKIEEEQQSPEMQIEKEKLDSNEEMKGFELEEDQFDIISSNNTNVSNNNCVRVIVDIETICVFDSIESMKEMIMREVGKMKNRRKKRKEEKKEMEEFKEQQKDGYDENKHGEIEDRIEQELNNISNEQQQQQQQIKKIEDKSNDETKTEDNSDDDDEFEIEIVDESESEDIENALLDNDRDQQREQQSDEEDYDDEDDTFSQDPFERPPIMTQQQKQELGEEADLDQIQKDKGEQEQNNDEMNLNEFRGKIMIMNDKKDDESEENVENIKIIKHQVKDKDKNVDLNKNITKKVSIYMIQEDGNNISSQQQRNEFQQKSQLISFSSLQIQPQHNNLQTSSPPIRETIISPNTQSNSSNTASIKTTESDHLSSNNLTDEIRYSPVEDQKVQNVLMNNEKNIQKQDQAEKDDIKNDI